jgi:hypothetical protein
MAQGRDAPVPASALKACASIASPAPRLACYDELAGRAAAPTEAPARLDAPATPAAAPQHSFGLYAAEHPAPATDTSLSAKVVALGASARGRPTVALEGGQLWELDGPDTLLAGGDAVTIRRAALGSYLMTTPQGRTHRVRRLR